jgi:hypothetical protein
VRMLGRLYPRAWLCGFIVATTTAYGFSDPSYSVRRTFSQRGAVTNSPILVTTAFINRGRDTLHGFCYAEQVPSALHVTPVSVTIDGREITNFIFECGADGDVYPGCTPWRWWLQSPTNFAEGHPVLPQTHLEIRYSITAASPGTFCLPQYSCVSCATDKTNTYFSCNDSFEPRTVKFVASADPPLVAGRRSGGSYCLAVDGTPGTIYLLAASSNLANWTPVLTNASPFTYVEPKMASSRSRFFRATPYLVVSADPFITRALSNRWTISVHGVAGCNYILEQSSDLLTWWPVETNVVPFTFMDTNVPGRRACFYRGRIIPPPQ